MLDFVKLQQFVVLARHGSYTTAAAALHVSQPTLTRSVQSLEKTLNARLLDRGRNGIELTEIGMEFLHHAEDLLRHANSIEADISMRARGIRGHVNVGAGPAIGGTILPGVIREVLASELEISVRTVLSQAHTMYSMILDGSLDFFISREPNPGWTDKLTTVVLGYARPDFFVRPSHPLLAQPSVAFADLARFPRICGTAWNEVLSTFAPPELARDLFASIEVDDFGIMSHLAHEVDAVLIANSAAPTPGLVRLDVDRGDALPATAVTLNRPAHRTLSPAVRFVMQLTVDRARELYSAHNMRTDSVEDSG
ncbi:LysR family transcriptional regulator [Streptomyces sp. NPDC046924]|uniref:LysR family transcriptional regulator n=1 Tax=Streptomyces sp. NPDC046924 TaxID=3155136 RepID=UPI0033CFC8F8